MSRPTIKIHDLETGQEIEREMTASELKDYETGQADYARSKAEAATKAQAKAQLLTKLGITAEEAVLLLS